MLHIAFYPVINSISSKFHMLMYTLRQDINWTNPLICAGYYPMGYNTLYIGYYTSQQTE